MKATKVHPWILFLPEIRDYIKSKDFVSLKQLVKEMHPIDLAECIMHLEPVEKVIVFELLPSHRMIEVFEELPYNDQKIILEGIESISLSDMETDKMAKLFTKASEKIKKKLYSIVDKEKIENVKKVMSYPPKTAGAIMHTDFITLSPNMTARQALEKVQISAKIHRAENIYAFYVTDETNKILGGVSLRKLITAPPDIKISEILTRTTLIELSPYDDLGHVVRLFKKYDLVIAPVVDEDKTLLGVIPVDEIMDLLHSTTVTQLHGFGKLTMGKAEMRYSELKSPFLLVKSRILWLTLLVILGYVGSSVIKVYESALTAVVALAFFIPMLCDTGGNAGCQTVTTIIRSLATGDITPKLVWKVVRYELISAVVMGTLVGIVGFLRALILVKGDYMLSIVVGLSVFCVIVIAIATGLVLPFLAKLIGIDPAVLSAPLITTVVDIVGLIAYFKIASILLPVLKQL